MFIAIVTTWMLFNLALAGLLTWAHRSPTKLSSKCSYFRATPLKS